MFCKNYRSLIESGYNFRPTMFERAASPRMGKICRNCRKSKWMVRAIKRGRLHYRHGRIVPYYSPASRSQMKSKYRERRR